MRKCAFLFPEDRCSHRGCLNINTDSAFFSKINNVCKEISTYLSTWVYWDFDVYLGYISNLSNALMGSILFKQCGLWDYSAYVAARSPVHLWKGVVWWLVLRHHFYAVWQPALPPILKFPCTASLLDRVSQQLCSYWWEEFGREI